MPRGVKRVKEPEHMADVEVVNQLLPIFQAFYDKYDNEDKDKAIVRIAEALSVSEDVPLYVAVVPILEKASLADLPRIFDTIKAFLGLLDRGGLQERGPQE